MEYFQGKMLNDKNIAKKSVARDVAQEIAKMHSLGIENYNLIYSSNSEPSTIVKRVILDKLF